MSVTKDKKTGKWMSQVRVKDWNGKTVHRKKRGFLTKKDALKWENDLLNQSTGSLGMTFKDFIELYRKDIVHHVKGSTSSNKDFLIDTKLLPYFGNMQLDQIKPTDIRKWQNELKSYTKPNGEHYKDTYLRSIHSQTTAIFNYAVTYYGLKENPCHKAGSMGKKNADEMLIWTPEEFNKFIETTKDDIAHYTAFMTLFYTGMREGELLALTPADIDFKNRTITINKSYQKIKGKDVITTTKTPRSNRVVVIPKLLTECLQDYMSKLYELDKNDRLFPLSKYSLGRTIKRGSEQAQIKTIRVHDLRHSHASFLINMGCSIVLIRDRLGHQNTQTTLDTYGHLFPNKQIELADKIDEFFM